MLPYLVRDVAAIGDPLGVRRGERPAAVSGEGVTMGSTSKPASTRAALGHTTRDPDTHCAKHIFAVFVTVNNRN
jgi:hypothetical protein